MYESVFTLRFPAASPQEAEQIASKALLAVLEVLGPGSHIIERTPVKGLGDEEGIDDWLPEGWHDRTPTRSD